MNARTAVALYVALAAHALVALVLLVGPGTQSGPGAGHDLGLALPLAGGDSVFAVQASRLPPPERENPRPESNRPAEKQPAAPAPAPATPVASAVTRAADALSEGEAPQSPEARTVADATFISRVRGGGGGLDGYFSQVRRHLYRFRRELPLPVGAAESSVRFELFADGSLGEVRLARSSGVAALDEEAMSLVRRAAPLPRPPQGRTTKLVVPISVGAP